MNSGLIGSIVAKNENENETNETVQKERDQSIFNPIK